MLQILTMISCKLQFSVLFRGRYFAERGSFWEGHFWGAPGQNFRFLEGKFENIKISRKNINIFCYLHLKSGNLLQKS